MNEFQPGIAVREVRPPDIGSLADEARKSLGAGVSAYHIRSCAILNAEDIDILLALKDEVFRRE